MKPQFKLDLDNNVAVLVMSVDEAGILLALLGKCPTTDSRSEPLYQALFKCASMLSAHRADRTVTIAYETRR